MATGSDADRLPGAAHELNLIAAHRTPSDAVAAAGRAMYGEKRS